MTVNVRAVTTDGAVNASRMAKSFAATDRSSLADTAVPSGVVDFVGFRDIDVHATRPERYSSLIV
jgi:hypothetical protein